MVSLPGARADDELESITNLFEGVLNTEREAVGLFGLRFKGSRGGLLLSRLGQDFAEESGPDAVAAGDQDPPSRVNRASEHCERPRTGKILSHVTG